MIRADADVAFRLAPMLEKKVREDGMGYQITIDYHKDGFIGSLYAPAEGGFIQQNKDWEKYFKKDAWNKLRA